MRLIVRNFGVLGLLLAASSTLTGCPQGSGEETNVSTNFLDFGSSATSLDFTVSNSGSFFTTLQYTAEDQQAWSDTQPDSGQSFTLGFGNLAENTHTVTIDRGQLAPGENIGTILVGAPDPNGGIEVISIRAVNGVGEGEGEGEGEIGEGEGEGGGGTEGEGEGDVLICTLPCEDICVSDGINAGVADALEALFQNPVVGADPNTADIDENGIIDIAHGRLLDTLLANSTAPNHCCILAAWDNNFALIDAVLEEIENSEGEVEGSAEGETSIFDVVERDVLQKVFTGLSTIGEAATVVVLADLLDSFDIDISISELDLSAAQYLASDGDADLDNVCNLGEYNAVVTDFNDFLTFVLVAIADNQSPNGGGCGPCYDIIEGEPEGGNDEEGESEGDGGQEGEGEGDFIITEGEEGEVEGSGDEGEVEGSGDEGESEGSGDEGESEGSGDEGESEGSGDEGEVEGSGDEGEGSGDEGETEGSGDEGEGSGTEGEGEEGEANDGIHSADFEEPFGMISLSELLRVIQFFNFEVDGERGHYKCAQDDPLSDDGYAPGIGDQSCTPHDSDYNPQDWQININELLRVIQFFNSPGGQYNYCPDNDPPTEDDYCPGPAA